MLEFLIGRACTGKTHEIIRRAAKESKVRKVILIVPEQFTFETERAVIKIDDSVQENIHVLSFSRLFDDVLQEFSVGKVNFISDFEKIILLKKALKECLGELKIFAKYTTYNDFAMSLNDTLRDLKFAAVTPEELTTISDKIGGTVSAKLKDIAVVMSTFDSLLKNKYIDPSDRLTKLAEMLCELKYFENCSVYFDSFSGFTGQQYKIIEKIIEQAENITFSFCTDDIDSTSLGVFFNINNAARKVKEIAKSRGITSYKITNKTETYYSCGAMKIVEKFCAENALTDSNGIDSVVNIVSCQNRRDEVLAAANIIAAEVCDNKYRFKDFIVVARNAEDYANSFSKQCAQNGIACFMDKSMPFTETPLFLYLEKLFESVTTLSTDNVLCLLKTGLINFSLEEISELENYTFVWDIHPSDWQTNWEMSVKGLRREEDSESDTLKLEQINKTRGNIVELISKFKFDFTGKPVALSKAIFNHLIGNNIDKNLLKLCDYFEENGNQYYSSILRQSWDVLVSILDSMVRVLDDENIDRSEFVELFKIAAASAKISNIPQTLDEVTFGAADRIRPSKPKISVILGANQGIFPKNPSNNGLLGAADKQKLQDFGIYIDDSVRSAVEENYLVYSMICCPIDKVYILYSRNAFNGESLEPSSFVTDLIEAFPEIKIKDFKLSSYGEFLPRTAESAFRNIGNMDRQSYADVKKSLEEHSLFSDKLNFTVAGSLEQDFKISKENAQQLFGNDIRISATKFDTFHRCSLSFLLKNGLRINKLQKADLNVLQRGTIAHFVLESMVSRHRGKLAEMSRTQISAEVDTLIHEYINSVNGSGMLMTARFAYLLEKISESVKEIVCHIAEEFAQSDFEPSYCELSIGDGGDIPTVEYVLGEGSKINFEGKIDRVDIYKDHVRVVDYKTGKKSFELSDTLVGLNMQMLLYLYAFIKKGGELVENPKPAGILYMPAKASKDKKSLRMNGLILSDEEIVAAMERENKGRFVPKYSQKSGEFVDADFFDLIFTKIEALMLNMGEDILNGAFSADPTDGVKSDACAYCDFSAICRAGNKPHNKVQSCSNEHIRSILKGGDNDAI